MPVTVLVIMSTIPLAFPAKGHTSAERPSEKGLLRGVNAGTAPGAAKLECEYRQPRQERPDPPGPGETESRILQEAGTQSDRGLAMIVGNPL